MVEIWRPKKDHRSYMDDPSFLERQFGASPLGELLTEGVVGVARLVILPSYSGESVSTFVYREREVAIEVRQARRSLWYSLSGNNWSLPVRSQFTQPLEILPAPLESWGSLVAAGAGTPSVRMPIAHDEEFAELDGVTYRFSLADAMTRQHVQWSNPRAPGHAPQVRLANAFTRVLEDLWRGPALV